MREKTTIKHLGFYLGAMSIFLAPNVFAQMPVSARVNISGSCPSCDLSNRVMPRLSLQGANFSGSDFSHSNLSGGKFHSSNLERASFYKAFLMRAEGDNIKMRGAILRDTSLVEAKFENSDISHSDLRRADMTKGRFSNSNFLVSNMRGVDAIDALFIASNFTGARFNRSNFTGADFSKAVFKDVKFGDAVIIDANFTKADLKGADLRQAQGLTQEQLNSACGDASTKLPNSMTIQDCIVNTDVYLETILPSAQHNNSQGKTVTIFLNDDQHRPAQPRQSDIDLALLELEAAMRDLPIDSPTRKKLYKSKLLLKKVQARKRKP